MENNFYHFSSPTQNNDIILYHQRSKSSLTGSHSHLKARVVTTDLTKNSQNTSMRSDRIGSTELGGGLPRPLQERINVSKSTFENGSTLSKTTSLLLDGENERRSTELEEENKDLKRQLKVRDTKIGLLLKENQEIQDKLDETQHFDNRNIQLQSENKCLKSELEALAKRVSELEDEKIKILAGKPYVPKSHDFDDIGHNLMKYTNYIVSCTTRMDKNTFVNFCFSERFSSEKDLLTLITSGEYGTIALQAFRYIIDLLANINQPTASTTTPIQNPTTQSKPITNIPPRKENKINISEQQHSVGYESKKTTPRELPRGNSNKNILGEEPEKSQDWRATSPFRVSASLEAKNQPRESVKKIPATKENKPRPGSSMSIRKDISTTSTGSTGQLVKGKRPEQGTVTPTNSSRLNSSMTSTRQGTGTDSRPKQRAGNDKEELTRAPTGMHLRRQSEGRRGFESEKGYMLLGGVSGVKTKESEHESSGSKKVNKRESFNLLERRLESGESNKYGSVGGSNRKTLDESLGGRGLQDNMDKVTENLQNRLNHSLSVRHILEQGATQKEEPKDSEVEVKNTIPRSEKSDIHRIKRPASLINRPAFDPKEKKSESGEALHEEKKSLQTSRDSTKERPFTHILSNQTLEEEGDSSRKRLRYIEVNLDLENQENRGKQLPQEVLNRNLTARPVMISHESRPRLSIGEEKQLYSTVIPQSQTIEKLRDINSDNIRMYKDKVRLCSMPAIDRPSSVQANVRKSPEKLGERFVTFDGNDNQNLFTCSSDKEEKEGAIASSNRKIEEIEISSIKVGKTEGTQQSGTLSSETNIANWIDSNRRKTANQSPQLVDTLNGLSLESNRVRGSRGELDGTGVRD